MAPRWGDPLGVSIVVVGGPVPVGRRVSATCGGMGKVAHVLELASAQTTPLGRAEQGQAEVLWRCRGSGDLKVPALLGFAWGLPGKPVL